MLAEYELAEPIDDESEDHRSDAAPELTNQDLVDLYMRDVHTVPKSTAEETLSDAIANKIGRRVRDNLIPIILPDHERYAAIVRGQEARQRLLERNLGLVVSLAHRYKGRGVSLADLIQTGNEGFHQGVDRFDPDLGTFSTYVKSWIVKFFLLEIASQGQLVSLKPDEASLMTKVSYTENELWVTTGEKPSNQQLADALEIPSTRVEAIRPKLETLPVSLEQILDKTYAEQGHEFALGTLVKAPEEDPRESEHADQRQRIVVAQKLAGLSDRHRYILERTYATDGQPQETFADIGRTFKITREAVRQAHNKAIQKLRHPQTAAELITYWR